MIFCTDRERARPATLTRATRELVCIPRESATMIAVTSHSVIFTAERIKPRSVPSSRLEEFRSLSVSLLISFMAIRHTIKVSSAGTSADSVSFPRDISEKAFIMLSCMIVPPFAAYMLPK